MEKHRCYVCNEEMRMEHKISYIDHYCVPRWDDHHLTIRFVNDKLIKMRLRFTEPDGRLHLKVHYDEGYSEVWGKPDSERIKIPQVIDVDFSDIPKLKNKIRTYLVFS
jgi:hypothetical protein